MGIAANLNSAMLGAPNRPDDVRLLNNPHGPSAQAAKNDKLHSAFTQFVGQTFYGQMIKSMRSTVGHAAYFNGGQAEKAFQSQLDQTLAEQMTKASADRFAEPMFQRQFPNVDMEANADVALKPTSQLSNLGQLSRR
jgi:Rod binding domain-containing protein